MFLKDKAFWEDALERIIATAAQTFLGVVPVTAVSFGEVQWGVVAGSVGLASILAFVKAVYKAARAKTGEDE